MLSIRKSKNQTNQGEKKMRTKRKRVGVTDSDKQVVLFTDGSQAIEETEGRTKKAKQSMHKTLD